MPISSPIPFAQALGFLRRKKLMPTDAGSADLQRLEPVLLARSLFSAKQTREDILQGYGDRIDQILDPKTRLREDGTPYTDGLDPASARAEMKQEFRRIGYQPDPELRGTLQDHGSDQRIDLVLKMNVQMAQGFAYQQAGQTPEALELYPCWELFRAEDRMVPRDWIVRWDEAAAAVGDDDALTGRERNGRMVARKDSPIWEALSAFGTPYPPFDYNSGMDVRAIDREEAVALGIIDELAVVRPIATDFALEEAA